MLLSVLGLTACGGDKVNKIDIGGTMVAGKPPAFCQVRILLNNDIFAHNDIVKIEVGFGFINSNIQSYIEQGAEVVLKIEAQNFNIIDDEGISESNVYEKTFSEYSDSKFVCSIESERYIPNYSKVFDLKINNGVECSSGILQVSAVIYYADDHSGKIERVYYATNAENIAFSAKSIDDAQAKLK
jgi:hypothetical protein